MFTVDGFEFETEEEANRARKEKAGIRYIKENTDINDPDIVYKLYMRLNKPDTFSTPVGFAFLVELQEFLRTIPYIKNEEIRPIHIEKSGKMSKSAKKEILVYKKKFHVALFFAIVLSVCLISMFTITYISGHSPYVMDYENEIIDKYESWQQELEEREKALDEREEQTEWTK